MRFAITRCRAFATVAVSAAIVACTATFSPSAFADARTEKAAAAAMKKAKADYAINQAVTLADPAKAILLGKQVGGCSERTIDVGHEKPETMKRPPPIAAVHPAGENDPRP